MQAICPSLLGIVGSVNPAARLALRVFKDPKFRALAISLGPAAAKAAGDLARQGRWRQLAIVHADAVVDGSLMRVPIAAVPHWVVWSGNSPVAAYPPPTHDLADAVRDVDLSKRQRPTELRLRSFGGQVRRRIGRS